MAVMLVCFFVGMNKLTDIEDRIIKNSSVMHHITTEFVIINPGEKWDVAEAK